MGAECSLHVEGKMNVIWMDASVLWLKLVSFDDTLIIRTGCCKSIWVSIYLSMIALICDYFGSVSLITELLQYLEY